MDLQGHDAAACWVHAAYGNHLAWEEPAKPHGSISVGPVFHAVEGIDRVSSVSIA